MTFSLVSAVTLLAVVSANPIEKQDQGFDVSEFSAGCIPHGSLCSFRFNLTTDRMSGSTICNASVVTAFILPDIASTACDDPSVLWSFTTNSAGGNYTLFLQDYQLGLSASKVWDKSYFPINHAGATVYQQYVGPSSFAVP